MYFIDVWNNLSPSEREYQIKMNNLLKGDTAVNKKPFHYL